MNRQENVGSDPFAVAMPPGAVVLPMREPSPLGGELGSMVREHAGAVLAARAAGGFVFLDLRGQSAEVVALSAEQTDKRIPQAADDWQGELSDRRGVLSDIVSDAAERPAMVRLVLVARPSGRDRRDRAAILIFATPEDVRAARPGPGGYCSGFRLSDLSPGP